VFISYTHDDNALAQRISVALDRADIHTTSQAWDVSSAQDLMAQLQDTIKASDVVVLLLSPAVETNRWVGAESEHTLSLDLDRRDIELIPVLSAPMDLPSVLRDRAVVDLTRDVTEGLRQLVAQIEATSRIDFSGMSPQAFDDLIADLLRAVGFHLDDLRHRADRAVDLRATYEHLDPFRRPETEVWLIQTKLYSRERVSVEAIRQLAGSVATSSGATHGLLVTNAQVTSVATEYVAKMERTSHIRLRILDGVELRRLLRQFPAVAARHFGGAASPERGSGGNP
jgi:hypothetical protein